MRVYENIRCLQKETHKMIYMNRFSAKKKNEDGSSVATPRARPRLDRGMTSLEGLFKQEKKRGDGFFQTPYTPWYLSIVVIMVLPVYGFCSEQSSSQPQQQEKIGEADDQQQSKKFYEEYLARYYPKALVIRDQFFSNQDVEKVAIELKAVVDLLATEPWFYIENKPQGFNLAQYWEFMIDQCSLINAYLKKAYVNLDNNKVYVLDAVDYWNQYRTKSKKSKRLIDYLKEVDNEVVASFYALAFDYVIKLFNEGILLRDMRKVNRYLPDLEFIINKLQGTMFEAEYQEYIKIAKDLLTLLRQKMNVNNLALDYLGDNNEQSKKYLQESLLLAA